MQQGSLLFSAESVDLAFLYCLHTCSTVQGRLIVYHCPIVNKAVSPQHFSILFQLGFALLGITLLPKLRVHKIPEV